MELQTLKTPSLLLDVAKVRRNAERMSVRVKGLGATLLLRPHVKTHKCVEVARLQTVGQAKRAITVSTLAEARAFAAHGFTDILYGVPIEPGKFTEALDIAKDCEQFSLITDDAEIPRLLSDAAKRAGVGVNLFLKVDCGYHRCGVEPHTSKARAVLETLAGVNSNFTRFGGILTHAGHSYHARTKDEILRIARHERDVMLEFADEIKRTLISVPIVSIGSTPTITHVDHLEGIDEVRPGNYIFFDAFQATLGSCSFDDCALTVLASVVHRDLARGKIIIDAGSIALSKDRGAVELDPTCGYGRVLSTLR